MLRMENLSLYSADEFFQLLHEQKIYVTLTSLLLLHFNAGFIIIE